MPSIAMSITVDLISGIFLICSFIVSFNSSTVYRSNFTSISYAVDSSADSNIPGNSLSSFITSPLWSRAQLISTYAIGIPFLSDNRGLIKHWLHEKR